MYFKLGLAEAPVMSCPPSRKTSVVTVKLATTKWMPVPVLLLDNFDKGMSKICMQCTGRSRLEIHNIMIRKL